jgi:hypothetical protein
VWVDLNYGAAYTPNQSRDSTAKLGRYRVHHIERDEVDVRVTAQLRGARQIGEHRFVSAK